jgi:N-acetylneuraminic acid mutarotase
MKTKLKLLSLFALACTLCWHANGQLVPFAFWKARSLFTWMGGPNLNTAVGVFGTQGTGSTSNTPGLRYASASWLDGSGNLWLFGGFGYDIVGTQTVLNDLWKYTPASATWTWVSGQPTGSGAGVYGTKGTAAAPNLPGARSNAASWIDASGKMWLFGGIGKDVNGNRLGLSDLWKYDPSSGNWTWVSGPNTGDQSGTYGTKGTGNTGNIPGGRSEAYGWIDGSGVFWLFGGTGKDSAGTSGVMNDLWSYDPGSGQWTWISGSNVVNASGTFGAKGASSISYTPGARSGLTVNMDASGNFWLLGGNGRDSAGASGSQNDLWKFTPSTKKWTWVSGAKTANSTATYGTKGTGSTGNTPGARYSHTAIKASGGSFWYYGGYGYDSISNFGALNELWKFDPTTSQWTWVSGLQYIWQIGVYGTKGTSAAGNQPGSKSYAAGWGDASGNIWFFGGFGLDSAISGSMNDVWKYDPTGGQWTWTAGYSTNLQVADYPPQGTPDIIVPSARDEFMTWKDPAGNFWLFGGLGTGYNGDWGYLNDLWKFSPGTQMWTWVSGSHNAGLTGVYGAMGTGSTGNYPGGRISAVTWVDAAGKLWLFGGTGYDSLSAIGYLNDLWNFDPATLKWTWMAGGNVVNSAATYGTKGTGSISNIPGGRDSASSWVDSSGNMWLFGGTGRDSAGTSDYLNDLWKLDPATLKWTWISGATVVNQGGTYGSKGTGNTGNTPGARNGMVFLTDASGNLWAFGGLGYDASTTGGYLNDLWKYAPSTNQWTWMAGSSGVSANGTYGTRGVASASNTPGGRQRGGGWVDGGGNLWLFGGQAMDSVGAFDIMNDVWRFNVATNQWVWISGPALSSTPAVFGTYQVPSPGNLPGPRQDFGLWNDGQGTVWFFGGMTLDKGVNRGRMNDLWKYSY